MVPVRFSAGGSKLILLGRRQGGRRYLSEDLDMLGRAAIEVSEKVESLRRREMERLVSQGELRALQSQINPHFLFNALNAVYGTIPREAQRARRIVLDLAEIFRYFLQSEKTLVPLEQEMQYGTPTRSAKRCSSSATSGPIMNRACSNTLRIRASMRDFRLSYWARKSTSSIAAFPNKWPKPSRHEAGPFRP